jgi:hypothetical protein
MASEELYRQTSRGLTTLCTEAPYVLTYKYNKTRSLSMGNQLVVNYGCQDREFLRPVAHEQYRSQAVRER